MTKKLTIEAESRLGILEIEKRMQMLGISIIGNDLVLCVEEKEYRIGREQTEFPRSINESFTFEECQIND